MDQQRTNTDKKHHSIATNALTATEQKRLDSAGLLLAEWLLKQDIPNKTVFPCPHPTDSKKVKLQRKEI